MKKYLTTLKQNLQNSKKTINQQIFQTSLPIKTIKLFLLTSFIIACSSTDKKQSSSLISATKYSGKVKFEVENKKALSASADIIVAKPDKVRIELSSILGINIASIAFDDSNLSYYLYRTKEYYSGGYPNTAKDNDPLNGLSIPFLSIPRLGSIVNKKIPKNWACKEEKDIILSCTGNDFEMTIQPVGKNISIVAGSEEFVLYIYIKDIKHNEMVEENIFRIPKS